MEFAATELPGVCQISLQVHQDERGSFARTWCRAAFAKAGLAAHLEQVSLAFNHQAGTLRGIHFQAAPHGEDKLFRIVQGAAFVVVVDLRPESPQWGKWISLELAEDLPLQLFVPAGCALAYQTLQDATRILYGMSQPYVPEAASGIRFDDQDLAINWPRPVSLISPADQQRPSLRTLFPERFASSP